MPYTAKKPELFIGHSAGNGQCAIIVERAARMPPTHAWFRGPPVKGNTQIEPGTVIATFDALGRYANATNGTSHAAIYLGPAPGGVRVLDQWVDRKTGHHLPASIRTLRFNHFHGDFVDNADNYHVVE